MKSLLHIFLILTATFFLNSCSETQNVPVYLAQGTMVGEVSTTTAILQTRLTSLSALTDGQVPGATGVVRFAYGISPTPNKSWKQGEWLHAFSDTDFIVKTQIADLTPNQVYSYQIEYGTDETHTKLSPIGSFRTHPGEGQTDPLSFVVVTGMNYYHFHYGKYDSTTQYRGPDKELGYPALASIAALKPDYFVGTGDNVYFDHPAEHGFQRAKEQGKHPLPGLFEGKWVTDEAGMRRKYHVQFVQPRFVELFQQVGTYWLKDDHDYRRNDSDPTDTFAISHELGIKNFREQLPVTFPPQSNQPTYRTYRMSEDVQIWLIEGRDYRSANDMEDGPEKTIWGAEQKAWIQQTLLESTATFKFFISPTPMVGPDDAYKTDNHVNHKGFRREGDAFFDWLGELGFLDKNFYFICGDRHWQYHAIHPSGFEEFSCGALVDANSRAGRLVGDKGSTDPRALIQQPYIQGTKEQASGGFLKVSVEREGGIPQAVFSFFDEKGELLYEHVKGGKL